MQYIILALIIISVKGKGARTVKWWFYIRKMVTLNLFSTGPIIGGGMATGSTVCW